MGNDVPYECNQCEDDYLIAGNLCYWEEALEEADIGDISTRVQPEESVPAFYYSALIEYLGLKSVAGCTLEKIPQQCQAMANLCVLSYYSSPDFCDAMASLLSDADNYANDFYQNGGYM